MSKLNLRPRKYENIILIKLKFSTKSISKKIRKYNSGQTEGKTVKVVVYATVFKEKYLKFKNQAARILSKLES